MEFSSRVQKFWDATDEAAVEEEIRAQDALARLTTCSLEEMILLFRHYRLFTLRHIDDLAVVMARLEFSEFKAFLTKVLFEEFGMETEGEFANNHVNLFDHFVISLGASPEFCRDPKAELSSNLEMLDDITDRVKNRSISYAIGLRGMGTECLCQFYLTIMFNMAEKNPVFIARRDELDLRFEQLHRGPVEAEHRRQMRERIATIVMDDPSLLAELQAGYEHARLSFHRFFDNIYQHIDQVLGTSAASSPAQ